MVESVLKGGYEVPDDRDRGSGDEPGGDSHLFGGGGVNMLMGWPPVFN